MAAPRDSQTRPASTSSRTEQLIYAARWKGGKEKEEKQTCCLDDGAVFEATDLGLVAPELAKRGGCGEICGRWPALHDQAARFLVQYKPNAATDVVATAAACRWQWTDEVATRANAPLQQVCNGICADCHGASCSPGTWAHADDDVKAAHGRRRDEEQLVKAAAGRGVVVKHGQGHASLVRKLCQGAGRQPRCERAVEERQLCQRRLEPRSVGKQQAQQLERAEEAVSALTLDQARKQQRCMERRHGIVALLLLRWPAATHPHAEQHRSVWQRPAAARTLADVRRNARAQRVLGDRRARLVDGALGDRRQQQQLISSALQLWQPHSDAGADRSDLRSAGQPQQPRVQLAGPRVAALGVCGGVGEVAAAEPARRHRQRNVDRQRRSGGARGDAADDLCGGRGSALPGVQGARDERKAGVDGRREGRVVADRGLAEKFDELQPEQVGLVARLRLFRLQHLAFAHLWWPCSSSALLLPRSILVLCFFFFCKVFFFFGVFFLLFVLFLCDLFPFFFLLLWKRKRLLQCCSFLWLWLWLWLRCSASRHDSFVTSEN